MGQIAASFTQGIYSWTLSSAIIIGTIAKTKETWKRKRHMGHMGISQWHRARKWKEKKQRWTCWTCHKDIIIILCDFRFLWRACPWDADITGFARERTSFRGEKGTELFSVANLEPCQFFCDSLNDHFCCVPENDQNKSVCQNGLFCPGPIQPKCPLWQPWIHATLNWH